MDEIENNCRGQLNIRQTTKNNKTKPENKKG